MNASTLRGNLSYGLLGLPLAMAALPVYVHIPAFYASHLDVGLAQLGWVIFAARLVDTMQDPFLGLIVDRLGTRLDVWLGTAAVVFALAFAGLWLPPEGTSATAGWLATMLVMVYSAHSFLTIAYLSWGASLDGVMARPHALLGPAAWREAAGLAGILVASVIPAAVMAGAPARIPVGMGWYSLGFAFFLLLALLALRFGAPAWQRPAATEARPASSLGAALSNQRFRKLLLPYLLNAFSVAMPATLVIFFIRDHLRVPQHASVFLLAYFASAACSFPLWVRLASRVGALMAWHFGMLLALAAFAWTATLHAGDTLPYTVICLAAGLALGADLAFPPVLFARAVGDGRERGVHYSIYTMAGKLALACSGLALPLLSAFGYRPGSVGSAPLLVMYAVVPCLFKLAAILALWRIREENRD